MKSEMSSSAVSEALLSRNRNTQEAKTCSLQACEITRKFERVQLWIGLIWLTVAHITESTLSKAPQNI
jgi:hypothetical protein